MFLVPSTEPPRWRPLPAASMEIAPRLFEHTEEAGETRRLGPFLLHPRAPPLGRSGWFQSGALKETIFESP